MNKKFFNQKNEGNPNNNNSNNRKKPAGENPYRKKKQYFKNKKRTYSNEENPHSSNSSENFSKEKKNFALQKNEKKGQNKNPYSHKKRFTHFSKSQRNTPSTKQENAFRKPRVILGKCFLCQANVSDEVYSLKNSLGQFSHFECLVKAVREKVQKEHPKNRDFKIYYTGSETFSAVIEKIQKGNIKWEILSKITLKEFETNLEENPTP